MQRRAQQLLLLVLLAAGSFYAVRWIQFQVVASAGQPVVATFVEERFDASGKEIYREHQLLAVGADGIADVVQRRTRMASWWK